MACATKLQYIIEDAAEKETWGTNIANYSS